MTAYQFGSYRLDLDARELRADGAVVHLEPQVFDVLAYLVGHRNRVVPKTELLDAVWGNQFVTDSAVTSRIKSARRAIGDTGSAQLLIRNQRGRGYRFVGAVQVVDDHPVPPIPGDTAIDRVAAVAAYRSDRTRRGRGFRRTAAAWSPGRDHLRSGGCGQVHPRGEAGPRPPGGGARRRLRRACTGPPHVRHRAGGGGGDRRGGSEGGRRHDACRTPVAAPAAAAPGQLRASARRDRRPRQPAARRRARGQGPGDQPRAAGRRRARPCTSSGRWAATPQRCSSSGPSRLRAAASWRPTIPR